MISRVNISLDGVREKKRERENENASRELRKKYGKDDGVTTRQPTDIAHDFARARVYLLAQIVRACVNIMRYI